MNYPGSISSTSLLDQALGLRSSNGSPLGHVILINDCVETSGAFLLHHLTKQALASSRAVLFVALAEPFSHYERILRKLGCNLVTQRENNKFFFFDMLQLECPGGDRGNIIEDELFELYGKIQRAEEICASSEYSNSYVTIIVDDVSLLEIAAHGFVDYVLAFLHYCHTLTSELSCSLVILNHQDIYSSIQSPRLISQMEYLADIVVKTEPLMTGLAADVHGQLTVVNKGIAEDQGNPRVSYLSMVSAMDRHHFTSLPVFFSPKPSASVLKFSGNRVQIAAGW